MTYTVEKRYIVDVEDGKPKYNKEVVENLTECSISMIDLHVEKGLDRVRIKKIDEFGQVIKEKSYYVGEIYARNSIGRGTDVYNMLFDYYKRDPYLVLEKGDRLIITSKKTFNIVSESDIKHEGTELIDVKEIGPNRKYQKGGYECI